MMRARRMFCRLALLLALSLAPLAAAAPKVIRTEPPAFALAVDPKQRALRIVFDQPMSKNGMSIVGGGPEFPEFVGKALWENEKTLVYTWKLEAAHSYWLSINSMKFNNFRSRKGEPAEPFPLQFHTALPKSGAAGRGARDELNRKAVEILRKAIDQEYSYRDLRRVDWAARFQEGGPALSEAPDTKTFAKLAALLIAPAQDIHFWFSVDGEQISAWQRDVFRNIDLGRLPDRVPGWKQEGKLIATGSFPDGIRYIFFRSWAPGEDWLKPAFDLLAKAAESKAPLIIDVRANGGGAEPSAQAFAGCFIDEPICYARHRIRSGGKLGEMHERVLKPRPDGPRFRGPCAVLIGKGTVSSSESFAMMMSLVKSCILLGESTAGASGNPREVDLGNGVTAIVPCWQDLRLDGSPLEGEGFAPTVAVRATPEDFEKGDPVLDAALSRLGGKGR